MTCEVLIKSDVTTSVGARWRDTVTAVCIENLILLWDLILKFDSTTLAFLRSDMWQGAYRHEKNIIDMTWVFFYICQAKLDYSKFDMQIVQIMTGEIAIS